MSSAQLIRGADYGESPVTVAGRTSVEELTDPLRLGEIAIQQLIIDSAQTEYVPGPQDMIDWINMAIQSPDHFVWVAQENGDYCGMMLCEDVKSNPWSHPILLYGYVADGASASLRRRLGSVLPIWAEERGLTEIWGYTHPDISEEYYARVAGTWGFDDQWGMKAGVSLLRWAKEN